MRGGRGEVPRLTYAAAHLRIYARQRGQPVGGNLNGAAERPVLLCLLKDSDMVALLLEDESGAQPADPTARHHRPRLRSRRGQRHATRDREEQHGVGDEKVPSRTRARPWGIRMQMKGSHR
jgi:hypothetical protein